MRRSDFRYHLPSELIAQTPLPQRSASRLLRLDGNSGECEDRQFTELPSLLQPGDLLIFNDTRVIPARLLGRKLSGGKVELLVEELEQNNIVVGQIRASKSPKPGQQLILEQSLRAEIVERVDSRFRVRFKANTPVAELLENYGHIPLPPYIQRPDDASDRERYQTMFARQPGAIAAPTAGLHFDQPLLDELRKRGVETGVVTLHVGSGTFQPMRCEEIAEHKMHPESVTVDSKVCAQIEATKQQGGRVVAVGTTSVRSLESAAAGGTLRPFAGKTQLFCYPGYEFQVVDLLITNFHLPESTLLLLVAAFGGFEQIMHAYKHAIAARYRFFSYGDAMLIDRRRI